MKKTKRVTFTIHRDLIDLISKYGVLWELSKSEMVSNSLKCGFEMMEGERNNKDILNRNNRNFKHTFPITVTLPLDVVEKLDEYSKWFKIKKSHLVSISIHYKLIDLVDEMLDIED